MGIWTARERLEAALNLEEPDRVPVAPYVGRWHAPRLLGLQISDYILGENRFRARVLVEAQRRHGYDWVMGETGHPKRWRENVRVQRVVGGYLLTDSPGTDPSFVPNDDVPHRPFGRLTPEQADSLAPPDHEELLRSGQLELIEEIVKLAGDDVPVSGTLGAPFWGCVDWIGLVNVMLLHHRREAFLRRLIDKSVAHGVERGRALVEAGASLLFVEEAFASADVIGPRLYERLVLPYERILVSKLRALSVPVVLSSVGSVKPIVERIAQAGADAYHFEESKKGFTNEIRVMRTVLRDKACLFAPFDAVHTLRQSSPVTVEEAAARLIAENAAGGGLVLSTGCPILKDTPPDNVDALVQAMKRQGRYC